MNLEPYLWGPHYWTTFHFMASTYDPNPNPSIKSTMKTFIRSIPVFLPCKECQDHAFEYIKSHDIDKVVMNRDELFTFFFNFHNSVNQRLNKPLMKFKDAQSKFFLNSNINSGKSDDNFKIIIFLILCFIGALYFILKKKNF